MDIPAREIQFFALADSVVFCSLICEDLARHSPVLPAVRAVGPTLLVALLLDGPQVRGRWGSRYAASLAEDPGTSVLTVSCLGMVEQSKAYGFPPSRTVALWKDQVGGEQEIALQRDERAVLLTVGVEWREEWIPMDDRAALMTLAPVLLSEERRSAALGRLEEEPFEQVLEPAVRDAIRHAFTSESAEHAIAELLDSDEPRVRAAGGILQWVHRSRSRSSASAR